MAAMAIEDSIRTLNRSIETLNINHFRYTNPVLAQVIMKTYHEMLKRRPELWDYLYDNDNVREKTKKFRTLLHKLNSAKLRRLMEWYRPDIIVCTQAFPCVAMAEYKRINGNNIPVVGVVTDYGVHSYWVDPDVDLYIVPTQVELERLVGLGIDRDRIEVIGIPISPRFCTPLDNKKLRSKLGIEGTKPVVLIMGGSQGMISMDEIVRYLAKLPLDMHLVVVCGVNKELYKGLEKLRPRIKVRMNLYGYINHIEELMSISDIIITKPGGLTITEALAKRLPMVILNPIPGQETKNAEFLIKNNAAVQALDARDVARRVGDLISNPVTLRQMKQSISNISRPQAAFDIARRIIQWDDTKCHPERSEGSRLLQRDPSFYSG